MVAAQVANARPSGCSRKSTHTRRSLILGFPAQLAALRSRLARFVEGAFVAGDQPARTLRGFYFTSGVQEGAPLDRILSGVAAGL